MIMNDDDHDDVVDHEVDGCGAYLNDYYICSYIGIITISNNRLNLRKDNGTVADVFTQESVVNLRGLMLLTMLSTLADDAVHHFISYVTLLLFAC